MDLNLTDHPCFNAKARHKYARVHLPVAPRCNVQCNYCNRDFDCVNESRPGVTSSILAPQEALIYLDSLHKKLDNIKVVGIAGPGDPFANPIETLETMRLIRAKYPDILLCVSTNGLALKPYIKDLAEIKVSHVTITINAVNPEVAEQIYAYVRFNKRLQKGKDAMQFLIDTQLEAIVALKEHGITVKINSIIVPGVNEDHIIEVTKKVKGLGADIQNCIPYYKTHDTPFENLEPPTTEVVNTIRKQIKDIMPQMLHCARCRADAVGLIGEKNDADIVELIKQAKITKDQKPLCSATCQKDNKHIAVLSREGYLINQHLGEAQRILIYKKTENGYMFVEKRNAPEPGTGNNRWLQMASLLSDCGTLIASGIGEKPKSILSKCGMKILVLEGVIEDILSKINNNESIKYATKIEPKMCGTSCSGNGGGCG